jgi:hypothetical protein
MAARIIHMQTLYPKELSRCDQAESWVVNIILDYPGGPSFNHRCPCKWAKGGLIQRRSTVNTEAETGVMS